MTERKDTSLATARDAGISHFLLDNVRTTLVISLVVAGLLAWALGGRVPTAQIAGWLIAVTAVAGLRFYRFRGPQSLTQFADSNWVRTYTSLTLLSGLVWGSAGILFFLPNSMEHQVILVFCLGGLAAGSIASYSSWLPAFHAFALPALLPVIVRLYWEGQESHVLMGSMLLIFLFGLSMLARNVNRTLRRTVTLQSALGDSEGRFRGVFESSPAGMALMTLEGNLVMVNRAFCGLVGLPREDLLGRDWREITHADDIAPTEAMDRQILSSPSHDLLFELRFMKSDRSAVWTEVATSFIRDDGGEPIYLLRQVFDISGLKKIEHLKNEFVSTVSHELRTPLTAIEGSLGLLDGQAAGDIPEDARNMISIARQNSRRLIGLVNDLLDIERLETDNLPFDFRIVDLSQLVEQVVTINTALATQHGVTLALQRRGDGLRVMADGERLTQVLTNLISNAVKFSPPGGTIDIEVGHGGGEVAVSVRDQGPGVPDDFRDVIFERFSQADSSDTRARGGAGLGLNISRAIIHKHRGELGYDSSPGAGARFYFTLPEWTGDTTDELAVEKLRDVALPARG